MATNRIVSKKELEDSGLSDANAMKRGGAVKATPKRATGYRGYGIAKKV